MIDRINDAADGPATILLTGLVAGVPYEASIRTLDLDMLAELASKQPGRTTQLGPVRVTILSSRGLNSIEPGAECRGHGRGGTGACCERAGEYNGYASGPWRFVCPKSCSCHD